MLVAFMSGIFYFLFFTSVSHGKQCRQNLSEIRYEEYTPYGERLKGTNVNEKVVEIKVMSYNVLAQTHITSHPYLYDAHHREAITWRYRSKLLLKEIKEADPDILCLQEVEKAHLKPFYSQLDKLGYKGLFKQHTGDRVDGIAIYYRTVLLNLTDQIMFEITSQSHEPRYMLTAREGVGIAVRLALARDAAQTFVVATARLQAFPESQLTRFAEIRLLLAQVDRLAADKNRTDFLPVILAGDLNITPGSRMLKMFDRTLQTTKLPQDQLNKLLQLRQQLVEEQLAQARELSKQKRFDTNSSTTASCSNKRTHNQSSFKTLFTYYKATADPKHSSTHQPSWQTNATFVGNAEKSLAANDTHRLQLWKKRRRMQSVYELDENGTKKGSVFQAAFDNKWVTLDYIFFTPECGLELVSRLRLPDLTECHQLLVRIPNHVCASDHMPLIATFQLLPQPQRDVQRAWHRSIYTKPTPPHYIQPFYEQRTHEPFPPYTDNGTRLKEFWSNID